MEPFQNIFFDKRQQSNQFSVKLLLAQNRVDELKFAEKKKSTRLAACGWSVDDSSSYRDLKPIIWALRFGGRLPLSVDDKGNFYYSYRSPWVLYSVVLYLISLVLVYVNILYMIDSLKASNFAIDELLFHLISVVYLAQSVTTPLCLPSEVIAFCNLANLWTQLKIDLYKLTGRSPYKPLLRLWTSSAAVCLPYSLAFAFVEALYLGKSRWQYWVPSFVHIYSNCLMFGSLWMALTNMSNSTNKSISQYLASMIPLLESSNNEVASRLAQLRKAWMRLSDLTQNQLYVNKISYSTLVLSCTFAFLVSGYMIATQLARWTWNERTVYFILFGPFIGLIFYIPCKYSQNILKSTNDLQRILLNLDTTKMSKATSLEVFMFIEAISKNPPVITLDDFVVFNKHTFMSFISITATYLVVLVQFRQQSS